MIIGVKYSLMASGLVRRCDELILGGPQAPVWALEPSECGWSLVSEILCR